MASRGPTELPSVHLHLVILQTLLSKATYNWGIHKAIHLKEANRQRKYPPKRSCSSDRLCHHAKKVFNTPAEDAWSDLAADWSQSKPWTNDTVSPLLTCALALSWTIFVWWASLKLGLLAVLNVSFLAHKANIQGKFYKKKRTWAIAVRFTVCQIV